MKRKEKKKLGNELTEILQEVIRIRISVLKKKGNWYEPQLYLFLKSFKKFPSRQRDPLYIYKKSRHLKL